MKKILLSMVLLCGVALADRWGIIESIDSRNKTIVINKSVIKVLPYTQIEEETCAQNGYFGMDVPRTFNDLKVGQAVELDFFGIEGATFVAEEIEIKCANRAY